MSVLTTLRNPNSISSIKHSYSYLFCRHIINFFWKDFPLKTMRNIQKVVIKISDAIFSFYVLSLVCPITPQNSIHISSICFCSVCFKYIRTLRLSTEKLVGLLALTAWHTLHQPLNPTMELMFF
jgi:hypothetical protein